MPANELLRKKVNHGCWRFIEIFAGYQLLFVILMVAPHLFLRHLFLPGVFTGIHFLLLSLFSIGLYLVLAFFLAQGLIPVVFRAPRWVVTLALGWSLLVALMLYLAMQDSFLLSPLQSLTGSANLLYFATISGALLSAPIKRIGELVPIAITVAVADLVSVLGGPSQTMIEDIKQYYGQGMTGMPPAIDHFLVKAALPGYTIAAPLFGVADWLLVILLSSCLMRLQLSDNLLMSYARQCPGLYLPVTVAALWVGVSFAQISNIYVPAMVFVSGIFLVFLMIRFKVTQELTSSDVLMSIVFPVLVVTVLWLLV